MAAYHRYLRVSTDRQADDGLSLDAQSDLLLESYRLLFGPRGYALGDVFREGAESGGMEFFKRPEGARLFLAVKTGDVIGVYQNERAFRSTEDMLATTRILRGNPHVGPGVVLYDRTMGMLLDPEQPHTKAMMTVMGAMAEQARTFGTQRRREMVGAARARGEFAMIRPPLGYRHHPRKKRTIVVDPAWVAEIEKIVLIGEHMGSAAAHRHCRDFNIKYRGKVPSQQHIDWLVAEWRKRRAGILPPKFAEVLAIRGEKAVGQL